MVRHGGRQGAGETLGKYRGVSGGRVRGPRVPGGDRRLEKGIHLGNARTRFLFHARRVHAHTRHYSASAPLCMFRA